MADPPIITISDASVLGSKQFVRPGNELYGYPVRGRGHRVLIKFQTSCNRDTGASITREQRDAHRLRPSPAASSRSTPGDSVAETDEFSSLHRGDPRVRPSPMA